MQLPFSIGDVFWRPIRGSLILALMLILYDAVINGSYLLSFFICPIWFVVALVRAARGRASPVVAVARMLIPVVTGLMVFMNAGVQNRIAKRNAVRIVEACEQYRKDTGNYPKQLDELVPQYLSSIPPAKHCCMWNKFSYQANFEQPYTMLDWVELPPFGRPTYNFEERRWGYLD